MRLPSLLRRLVRAGGVWLMAPLSPASLDETAHKARSMVGNSVVFTDDGAQVRSLTDETSFTSRDLYYHSIMILSLKRTSNLSGFNHAV